jgi:hypothetical protein
MIQLDGHGTLSITVGKRFSVVVETTESELPFVTTAVSGNRLRISAKHRFAPIPRIEVTLPVLTALSLSGSTEATVAGPTTTAVFELVTAGAAIATIENLSVEEFNVSLAGASTINVSGKAESMSLRTAGSTRVELAGLETTRAEVSLVGAANADLHVTSELSGKITGKGVIHLAGTPQRVDIHTLGSSEIIRHQDAAHTTAQ